VHRVGEGGKSGLRDGKFFHCFVGVFFGGHVGFPSV
jgi:hypothetical protein